MNIYHATTAERRMVSHIESKINNYFKIPENRCLDFGIFHRNSYGVAPYTAADQIMVDRVSPPIESLRLAIVAKNSNLGVVTVDVSMLEEKWGELSFIFEQISPIIKLAYPGDLITFKYLYIDDRDALKKGSQEEKVTLLDGWKVRLAEKTLVPTALTIVSTWVGQYKALLALKSGKKDNVEENRDSIDDIIDQLFDAIRQNYGDLYRINSKDIRPLLRKFDTNLLKHNASDSSKLKVNEFLLDILAGQTATADYDAITPKSIIVADNRKNAFPAIIFLSILAPGAVPDFAVTVPEFTLMNIKAPLIGPKYPKKINGKFVDPLGVGIIKITVKKAK